MDTAADSSADEGAQSVRVTDLLMYAIGLFIFLIVKNVTVTTRLVTEFSFRQIGRSHD